MKGDEEFQYARSNDGPDLRAGKLVSSKRINWVDPINPLFGGEGGIPITITQSYRYEGRDGRVSARQTRATIGVGHYAFLTELEWTRQGNLDLLRYPRCLHGGCVGDDPPRQVDFSYVRGALTSVSGYAPSLSYQLGGMLHQVEHANGVTETIATKPGFPMQRPHQITTTGVAGGNNWSSGTYLYDGAGNVKRIGSQRYQYDRMSRLLAGEVLVGGQNKTQTLDYDAFGNLESLTTDGSFQSTPTSNATNRLNNADYDAGGNLTDVTLSGETYQYTYDPLNMMKYLQSDTGQARVFLYDADDERIMTFDCAFVDGDCAVPAQLTTTIRGLDGKVLRIYNQPFGGPWDWERDYVYRDGQLLASVEPAAGGGEDTVHFHLDHLGSPRQITDEGATEVAFHTYYPFGGEATEPSQDDVELKFTGHERDDNGSDGAGVLDYMHARYCAPALGRFTSIDPKTRRTFTVMPQRWNRFSYSAGNPLKFVDPDGRDIFYANEDDKVFYEKRAARNHRVRSVLNAFAPGTGRDLYVNRGDPGVHQDGVPRAARTDVTGVRQPPTKAMIEAYEKAGGGEAGEEAANATYEAAPRELVEATIVLGPAADRFSKLHELGHIEQALEYPLDYWKQAAEASVMDAEEYEESEIEKYANAFATYALKAKPDDPTE